MSNCLAGGSTGMLLGALINGGLSAALGAASGATGAAILDASGYAGYSVLEATQMGAAGNAVMGAATGACVGGIIGCVGGAFFGDNASDDKKSSSGSFIGNAVAFVGTQTLGGLLGWAMLNGGDKETMMKLGQTAASLATGSAVLMIPVSCLMTCIVLPLFLAAMACFAFNADKDEADDTSKQMTPV